MNLGHPECYESNLELLKKHHTKIWESITQNPPEPSGEISYTPNDKPNITVINGQDSPVTLHLKINPEKESQDFLEAVSKDHKGFVAILGMGLCYNALKILKERPYLQFLAIFELDPGIFVQALRYVDLSPILEDPRLILGIGTKTTVAETLAPAFHTIQLESSNVFHQQPSFEYNPQGYNQLKEDLFTHLNSLNVEGTTVRTLGKNFFTNRFEHISTIHHHLLLEHLHNRFEGIPAILVAGGPSLNKNIHLLKQAQKTAVIIAVDTVLPTLLENDVQPHFLTCIDANNLTFEKFADVIPKVKNTALICSSWVNPKTAKAFPADQTFWTFTGKSMEAWFNSLFDGKILTGGASTVAHLNLIAAHMLGCSPVIFIGQDLAYSDSDSATHAQGTVLQGKIPSGAISRHTEGETVTGINGKILRTNRSFLSMKKFFESAIATSQIPHINATEGGANIEGTKIMALQEAIDRHCNSQINVTQQLKAFYSIAAPINAETMLIEFGKISDKIKQVRKTIKKVDTITKTVLKEILILRKNKKKIESIDMLSPLQRQQIKKIDKFHNDLDSENELWHLLKEITMEGLKKNNRQQHEIALLKNNSNKYDEWLIQSMNRLLDINKIRNEILPLFADNINMVVSFHQKENKYLEQIDKGIDKGQSMLQVVRLYMTSKNYNLARPLLEKLCKIMPESGEVYFYLGCLASQYNIMGKADQYFETAKKFDPKLNQQINSFNKEISDNFLKFARYFKGYPERQLSVKHMVKKGLRYHPTHIELKKELEIILEKDLMEIKSDFEANDYQKAGHSLNEWYQFAMDQKELFNNIPKNIVSNIFLYQGRLFLSEKDYENALESFKTAMKHSPDDHDIHHHVIETLFVTGNFNNAIKALNDAIKLDNQFAIYWQTIGDSLKSAGQYEDAIMAYEKCFTHLPDNINLLKTIGDCYVETDQLEAAKEAYEQFKSRMEL